MHEPYQGLNHTVKMSIGNQTEKSAEIIFPSLYYSEMWPGPTTTVSPVTHEYEVFCPAITLMKKAQL